MPGRNSSLPNQCIVHVSAIHQNIYATSLVPVTLPPVGNASLHRPFTLNGTTDLSVTGTTSLQPGQKVYVQLGIASHPCPVPMGKPLDHDTQWTCGGSSCSVAGLNQPVIAQQGPGNYSGPYMIDSGLFCGLWVED